MEKREKAVTFQGNPLTLLGTEIKVGNKAPNFTALGNDLAPVSLSDFSGKIRIISAVPSLDTPVCDAQTRRFNQEAAALKDVVILTLSCDLPFAQARFCGAAGIDAVKTLSDHKDLDFGVKYGLAIEELRLLTRAVIVVDKDDTVKYVQIVPEVTNEPDYAAALACVKSLA